MKIYNQHDMADIVAAMVRYRLSKLSVEKGFIFEGCYQNGREQGFSFNSSISGFKKSLFVCFAEYRRSDDVVVYSDEHDPMQSITEDMYKNAKFFNDYQEAADYICELFISNIKKEEEVPV